MDAATDVLTLTAPQRLATDAHLATEHAQDRADLEPSEAHAATATPVVGRTQTLMETSEVAVQAAQVAEAMAAHAPAEAAEEASRQAEEAAAQVEEASEEAAQAGAVAAAQVAVASEAEEDNVQCESLFIKHK